MKETVKNIVGNNHIGSKIRFFCDRGSLKAVKFKVNREQIPLTWEGLIDKCPVSCDTMLISYPVQNHL